MSLTIFRDQDDRDGALDPAQGPQAIRAQVQRSLGPDLVRSVAAILVVYLHASVAYLNHPMPGLVWATQDAPSSIVSHLFWSIELFIMPLFLLLAGFFAYRSWSTSGDLGLIRSRIRRLLVPFLAAAVVLLPIDYLIWLVGWVIDGSVSADRLWPPKFPRDMRQHLFGFAHLWFLQYVFLYCIALAGFGLLRRHASAMPNVDEPSGDRFGKSSQALFVAACSLPLIGLCVLLWAPEVVFGFQHAFAPVASKWLYSGTFFFGGLAMAAFDPRMSFSTANVERLGGVGVVCGLAAILLGQWAIERADSTSLAMDIGLLARILLASLTVMAAWTVSLAVIGLGNLASPILLQRPRARRLIAYFAGASFWVYLVHHPIVALLQIDLKWLLPQFSSLGKSFIVTAVAVGIGIASYEALIRGRFLGRALGLDGSAPKTADSDPVQSPSESRAGEVDRVSVTPNTLIPERSIRRAA